MNELTRLEDDILQAITAASDMRALEEARVAFLGKKGSVSALMKTLGTMTPEERRVMGPALNGLRDRVAQAIAVRQAALHEAALERRLREEVIDVTAPVRPAPSTTPRSSS